MLYLIVFIGAGIGGALRHGVNVWAARMFGFGFPFGTLIVNIVGSLLMGVLAGLFVYRAGLVPQHARLFLTTGILGGFTTFSASARRCVSDRAPLIFAGVRRLHGRGRCSRASLPCSWALPCSTA